MTEIKVNWELAPEDATELVRVAIGGQRWRNPETKQYWGMNGEFDGYYSKGSPLDEAKVLATRPKTITDAYEALKDRNPSINYAYVAVAKITHCGWLKEGDFEFVGENFDNVIFEILCTREQYEAYVKEKETKKEDEQWTHTCDGNECKLLVDKHDLFNRMPIQHKSGEYGLVHISDLKPIEPKLTKEQCEVLIKFSSEVDNSYVTAEVESYLEKYS